MTATVAKVIVEIDVGRLLMSRKRAPGKRKDHRLEFLGGRVDPTDANEWEAMLREAQEEELSGGLLERLRTSQPEALILDVPGKKGIETHALFHVRVARAAIDTWKPSAESYGFELVPADWVSDPTVRQRQRDEFTPKTLRILQALDETSAPRASAERPAPPRRDP